MIINIYLSYLIGKKFEGSMVSMFLNDDLIQTMEETPDTVITLTNGIKYVVKENCEEIKTKIIEYKRMIFASDKY